MKNLSIRLKLMFSVGGLALGYLLFLGVVTWTGTAMQKHLRIASDSLFPSALAGQQADASFQKLIKDYKDAVLTQDTKSLDLADQDAYAVATQLQVIKDKTAQNAELQKTVSQIQEQFKSLSAESKSVYSKMISAPDSMDDQAMAAVKNVAAENTSMTSALNALNDLISKKDFQGELNSVTQENSLQRGLTLLLFAIASAFAVFTTIVLYKQIAVPLKLAVDVFRRLALGDLTASLEASSKDEVGAMAEALNSAVAKLNETMQLVTESASNASAFSQQLATAAGAIASGAQEQAASLEETAASLEQITATVRQSADNANQASQLASGSKDSALQGQDVVSNAITAMSEINAASAKISDIISTIDEIAFQTNLLAVNAAVEAARAGDEGRGFAVVASEVRSLAQRSAVAAKEIKGLIQDTLRKVDAGSSLVNRSGETLQGIVGSVRRVTDIVGEIAAASGEQSAGIEQVNTAMTQMDHVTQSNSAQTEELSATAQSLSEQAAHLMDLVTKFTLHRDGKGGFERHSYSAYDSKPAASAGKTPVHAASSAKSSVAKKAGKVSSANPVVNPRSARKNSVEPHVFAAQNTTTVNDASFEEF